MPHIGHIEDPIEDWTVSLNTVAAVPDVWWVSFGLTWDTEYSEFLLTARQARALADLLHIAANSIDPQPSTVVDL